MRLNAPFLIRHWLDATANLAQWIARGLRPGHFWRWLQSVFRLKP
jgi:hypothetical protein